MKPTIGITCSLWAQREEWLRQEGRTFDHLKREYYQLVEAHGGLPVLLPNVRDAETAAQLIARVDGLLLSGGDDLDPTLYGEENRFPSSIIHSERDRLEIAFTRLAADAGKPVLGICRGIQVMNVAFGGTLFQDTSLRPGTPAHRSPEPFSSILHAIRVVPDSRLGRLCGKEEVTVNSRHHQHLKDIAPGFTVSAAAADDSAEAIERIHGRGYLLGVQWHPESTPADPLTQALFVDFIRAAIT